MKARLRGQARALRVLDITAERTMLETGRIAFVDRRGLVLKPLDQWTPEEGALLEGFETIVKNAAGGDGHQDVVHKVHLAKKMQALHDLLVHFGQLTEKVELRVTDELLARLDAIKIANRGKP